MTTEPEIAWEEARRLRGMLEQTLNREQRRELDELLHAWLAAQLDPEGRLGLNGLRMHMAELERDNRELRRTVERLELRSDEFVETLRDAIVVALHMLEENATPLANAGWVETMNALGSLASNADPQEAVERVLKRRLARTEK